MNVKLLTIALLGLAASSSSSHADLTFGLAGHSGCPSQAPYKTLGFDAQIDRLNSLKMTVYRGAELHWDFPTFGTYGADKLRRFVDKFHAAGIEPIIVLDPWPQSKTDETDAYNSAYNLGRYVAQNLAGRGIKYWEIGNEFDLPCLLEFPKDFGRIPADYDTAKYNKARGTVKGLMIGIRSVTDSGMFLVGGAGSHWGFTQRLYNDGVRWDYTKFHWYSQNDGSSTAAPATDFGANNYNLLKILRDAFHKPLFCTEVGVNAPQFDYDDDLAAAWFKRLMTGWTSVAATYDLQFACIYEMLDQPDQFRVGDRTKGIFRGDAGHIGQDKPQSVAIRNWMYNHPATSTP